MNLSTLLAMPPAPSGASTEFSTSGMGLARVDKGSLPNTDFSAYLSRQMRLPPVPQRQEFAAPARDARNVSRDNPASADSGRAHGGGEQARLANAAHPEAVAQRKPTSASRASAASDAAQPEADASAGAAQTRLIQTAAAQPKTTRMPSALRSRPGRHPSCKPSH